MTVAYAQAYVRAFVPTATPWKTLPMTIIETYSAAARMTAATMNKIPLYLQNSKHTLRGILCTTYRSELQLVLPTCINQQAKHAAAH